MKDVKDFNDVRWDSTKPAVEDCGWHTTERDAALIRSLRDEIERLREALRNAYQDCIDAVGKVKSDPFTELGVHHKSGYGTVTAKDWMVAFAEDVEREIKARAALGEGKE